ncbi:MAG: hypothetical protein P8N19_04490 [Flavobacteriales bacterium]|nr:hypothetical protein [Flavobacteriales bacterium]MDG1767790.1 hypothetical protein [Flavobacteriales bacterium]
MSKENEKKIKEEIRKQLFSAKEELVLEAVEKTRKHADASFIEPLLLARLAGSADVHQSVDGVLNELKISDAEAALIEALEDERFVTLREQILSYIWHSGFQAVDAVAIMAKIAVNGSYMEAFEALTVVEQMTDEIQEAFLLEALIELRAGISEMDDSDARYPILVGMLQYLTDTEDQQ